MRSTGRKPSRFSSAIASALDGLTVSATTKIARRDAVPRGSDRGLALVPARAATSRVELGRRASSPHSREERRPAGDDRVTVDDPFDAEAVATPERLDGRGVGRSRPAAVAIARAIGCSRGVLERADEVQRLGAVDAVGRGDDLDERHLARR